MPAPLWPLYGLCLVFLLTASLGASVQYAHVRLGRWHWLHHGLFACNWLLLAVAVLLGLWWQAWWWWLPLLLLPVLALFPLRRAITRGHRLLALAGFGICGLILLSALIVG